MKYVIKCLNGNTEIREDSSVELPEGARELNDAEYIGLCSSLILFENGELVTNPNPTRP